MNIESNQKTFLATGGDAIILNIGYTHTCLSNHVGMEYVWNYGPLPSSGYEKSLEMAPRFEKFQDYVIDKICPEQTQNTSNLLYHRLWEYYTVQIST